MEVEQWCIQTDNSTKALFHTGVLVTNITEEQGPGGGVALDTQWQPFYQHQQ